MGGSRWTLGGEPKTGQSVWGNLSFRALIESFSPEGPPANASNFRSILATFNLPSSPSTFNWQSWAAAADL